jgi:hypothetical protein
MAQIPSFDPRTLLARIGKCLMFGCSSNQTRHAANLIQRISKKGNAYLAGMHGFPAHWAWADNQVAKDPAEGGQLRVSGCVLLLWSSLSVLQH